MSGPMTRGALTKGALVSVPLLPPVPSVILFQYNPETVSRSVKPSYYGSGSRGGARFSGAPTESVSMDVQLDATDAMEKGSAMLGIRPQLSALEILAYPNLIQVGINQALMAVGTIEAVPLSAPMTLLIFGPNRVVPVRLTGFEITEEFFDSSLNPIRAKVGLSMEVVSYSDVGMTSPSYYAFIAHQTRLRIEGLVGMVQGWTG